LSCLNIPKNVNKALDHVGWQHAMIIEMQALETNNYLGANEFRVMTHGICKVL